MTFRALVRLLPLVMLLSGCLFIQEAPLGVNVSNNTSTAVDLFYPPDGPNQGRLEPTESRIFGLGLKPGVAGQECTMADIVARSTDGTEMARVPPPICIDRNISLSEWLTP